MRLSSRKCGLRRELEQPRGGKAANPSQRQGTVTGCGLSRAHSKAPSHPTGASVKFPNPEPQALHGKRLLPGVHPSGVSLSAAATARPVASLTLSYGGGTVTIAAPAANKGFGQQGPGRHGASWRHFSVPQ